GFALVDHDQKQIVTCGVHCFEKAEVPKTGASLALPRRTARGARRRLRRRSQRLRQLKALFLKHGLLNTEEVDNIQFLTSPWALRKEALDRLLSGPELARVLLHIAKRRGF